MRPSLCVGKTLTLLSSHTILFLQAEIMETFELCSKWGHSHFYSTNVALIIVLFYCLLVRRFLCAIVTRLLHDCHEF
jgi:hypothetical protein